MTIRSKPFAALLLAGAFLAPLSAESAQLKAAATVSGNEIRLGDVFVGLPPEKAGIVVAAAPAPGRRVWLDAPLLSRWAAAHQLDWAPSGGADRLPVDRTSHSLDADTVVAALTRALVDAGAPEGLEVLLDNRTLSIELPTDVSPTLTFANLRYDPTTRRVQAELLAPADGPPIYRQPIGARAFEVVEVPVPARAMQVGEVVTAADLDWTTVPADRMPAGLVLQSEALVGQALRRNLPAGKPVRIRDIQAPVVVPRNGLVTLLLQTPSMTVTAQGKALVDGAMGETIRVVNVASNRTLEAVVAGPDLVVVKSPARRSSAPANATANAAY